MGAKNILLKIRKNIGIVSKIMMWVISGGIALTGLVIGIFTMTMGDILILVGAGFIIGGAIIAFTVFSFWTLISDSITYELMAQESAADMRKNKYNIDDDIDV